MEASRRGVEAYWRSRLIDQATTDDDKVTPVFRLDEISDTIRSSPAGIVREMIEYILKRLDSKSPRVKQKGLRLIKYTVGKSGPEFKRELQRQSGAIRQLLHYKGTLDALRGDSLNKAVRDTAHETITAIFASDEKPSSLKEVSKRMEGFGSSNFDMTMEGKKSLLNEVVGRGSASIRQGLNMISGYSNSGNAGSKTTTSGSYRGPSLRKSLTSERETFERHEREDLEDSQVSMAVPDSRVGPSVYESPSAEGSIGRAGLYNRNGVSQEERLLDTLTTPGGVRLHPTRESLQAFLTNALKLDPSNLGYALESKLQAHSWQVRLKALCVLEAILQQEDQIFFGAVVYLFEQDATAVHECLQSPQASLREKAKKVLALLGALSKQDSEDKSEGRASAPVEIKNSPSPAVEMPDLIDTREPDLLGDTDPLLEVPASAPEDAVSRPVTTQSSVLGDLLGDQMFSDTLNSNTNTAVEDPFAGVSFLKSDGATGDIAKDLFSGLSMNDGGKVSNGNVEGLIKGDDNLFGGMSLENADAIPSNQSSTLSERLTDLMGNASMVNSTSSSYMPTGGSGGVSGFSKPPSAQALLQANSFPGQSIANLPNPQMMYVNSPFMLPMGMVGAFQPNMMLPQAFTSGGLAFGGMSNGLIQQQLLAGMAGLQRFGVAVDMGQSGGFQGNTGPGIGLGSSFADGFDFSSDPTLKYSATTGTTKKEETRAFDFISDHVGAVRGLKKAT